MDEQLLEAMQTVIDGLTKASKSKNDLFIAVETLKAEQKRLQSSIEQLKVSRDAAVKQLSDTNLQISTARREFDAYKVSQLQDIQESHNILDQRVKEIEAKQSDIEAKSAEWLQKQQSEQEELNKQSAALVDVSDKLDEREKSIAAREEFVSNKDIELTDRASRVVLSEDSCRELEHSLDVRAESLRQAEEKLKTDQLAIASKEVELANERQAIESERAKVEADKSGVQTTLRAIGERSKELDMRETRIKDREAMYHV